MGAVDFPEGMTWYGDPIDTKPGSRGRDTTASAGLRPRLVTTR